ncbi:unnamed protein product [Adineta steineri]|uniref:Uncharacterized protein n=1 Tax=Adineta steineri TaxID=433720 RepID=A0A815JSH9_9BILA|nr:unnamed protein product [Adineta steineri]CAF1382910.1 unnamed protein product [Adineta steineri]
MPDQLRISLHHISPLINDPTRSRFPPNTLVSTIFKEMMVEEWNVSSSYKDFYESCAPIYCTYSEKMRTNTIVGIILTLMSVIGGLIVSLRLITPYLVQFFFYLWAKTSERHQNQQQDEQVHGNWCDRFKMTMRNVIKLLHSTLINLNIFSLSDIGSTLDPIKAKRLGQWATRLYIALFIGGLSILTVYNLIQPQMMTKTFNKPPFNVYKNLKKLYGDELKCPCSVIATVYSQFIEIEPTFHKICSSPFASEEWRIGLTAGLVSNLSIYARKDYRRFLSPHLQFLQGLCQFSMNATYNSVNQFLTSLLVTSELLSETNFHQKLELLIEQSKSNAPTTFRQLLFLIRTINHGNAFMSTYGTNFEYIVPKDRSYESYAPTRALIYDDACSCGLCSNCTTQASFMTFNSSGIIPIKGLKIGCTPTPICKSKFRSISMNTSNFGLVSPAFVFADFNNDNRLDLVIYSAFRNTFNLLVGNGDGGFGAENIFSIKNFSFLAHIGVGDFNNDNRSDLVLTSRTHLGILVGNGNGTFGGLNTLSLGAKCTLEDITVANFNHDNYSDIAVVSMRNNNICVFLGKGNGTLSLPFMFSTGHNSEPRSLNVGDFNSDGHLDIAVTNNNAVNVGVFIGCGNGTFEVQKQSFTIIGSNPINLAVGDFDGDTHPDIVTSNDDENIICILSGYSNGIFDVRQKFFIKSVSTTPSVAVGDFNCDGHLDIVVGTTDPYSIDVLLGYGDVHFDTQTIFSTQLEYRDIKVVVHDFNGDTYQDLAVMYLHTNTIDIRLNICECCPREILKKNNSSLQ